MSGVTALVLLSLLAADPPVQADIVIRGATLIDGTGKVGFQGDLAIRGERIVAVGAFQVAGQPRVIDGAGLIVAPGFIDLHTHSDKQLTEPGTRANLCYLLQGVTTVVTGNCSSGPVDVAAYLRAWNKAASAATSYTKSLTTGSQAGYAECQPHPPPTS